MLKSDPQKTKDWHNRSRRPLKRSKIRNSTADSRSRGDLSGALSAQVYAERPKGMTRSKMRKRRPSKQASIDGDHSKVVKDECDQLVRDIIALRDRLCISCGEPGQLEVGHLYKRGNEQVRWCLLNVSGQHSTCNKNHNEDESDYIGGFLQRYGEEAYNELRVLSRKPGKLQYTDLLAIRDGLRAELERLRTNAADHT